MGSLEIVFDHHFLGFYSKLLILVTSCLPLHRSTPKMVLVVSGSLWRYFMFPYWSFSCWVFVKSLPYMKFYLYKVFSLFLFWQHLWVFICSHVNLDMMMIAKIIVICIFFLHFWLERKMLKLKKKNYPKEARSWGVWQLCASWSSVTCKAWTLGLVSCKKKFPAKFD